MDRNVDNSLIIREINMRFFTDFSAYDFQSNAAFTAIRVLLLNRFANHLCNDTISIPSIMIQDQNDVKIELHLKYENENDLGYFQPRRIIRKSQR